MIRATTGGVLKSYRSNLMNSFIRMNNATNTVLTQRVFNSYAEDPAAASKAFQLRRSYLRTENQKSTNSAMIGKYETANSALTSVINMVDNRKENSTLSAILAGENDPTGDARVALGKVLGQLGNSIVETMNSKYGSTFIFAGADGLNVPFEMTDEGLTYRGVLVDAPTGDDAAKLDYMSNESYYVDIGLGFQWNEDSDELFHSSGFDAAFQGINFLGYGVDEEGDPKNVVSLISRMADILNNYSDEAWNNGGSEDFNRLAGKLEDAAQHLKTEHANKWAETTMLRDNYDRLDDDMYTLTEQYGAIEDVDMAEAISDFLWAQYCYNAALKMGNSILPSSLMDYLQ